MKTSTRERTERILKANETCDVTIALSEHRRIFRIGGQAVDGLLDRINDATVLIVLDEPADPDALLTLMDYYYQAKALIVYFTYAQPNA